MLLKELLKDVEYQVVQGNLEVEIKDLVYDSRKATCDTAFFALTGFQVDGHDYIDKAIENECRVILVEKDVMVSNDITVIKLKDTRRGLARVSRTFFGYPDQDMTTIAITGTKGKTTTSWTVMKMLEKTGKACGVIGTMGVFYLDKHYSTVNTTPEAYDVYKYMREMLENNVSYLVMEVSSQSLKLRRLEEILFDYAVFTNLSLDHVGKDEHDSYEDYVYCKSKLFQQCRCGIFNVDDKEYPKMVEKATCDIVTFGTSLNANYRLVSWKGIMEAGFLGIDMQVAGKLNEEFRVSIPGDFSAMNALCAVSVCSLLGVSVEAMKATLEHISVKGRLEPVNVSKKFHVLIDYAYQGIAMENVIKTIRRTNPEARIVTLFGCGGNRSRQRRYDMGEIAGNMSDFSILTADNSRYEDTLDIIEDILVGYRKSSKKGKYVVIPDRKEAIRYSIVNAKEGDVILILGKGHEVYQEVKGERIPFDERVIIREILDELTEEEKESL